MAVISLGSLEKMKILSFSDNKFKIPTSTYIAMFNPSEFIEKSEVAVSGTAPSGTKESIKFNNIKAQSWNIDFTIDGTKASGKGIGPPTLVVQTHISLFKNTVLGGTTLLLSKASKESHEPPYLILQWGKFIFKCRCIEYTIKYTLFSSVGLPIRAVISATFLEVPLDNKLSTITRFLSPDLTKSIVVKEGDTLPLLAEREYGDPGLYLEVAKANNLTNFRKLKPGTVLYFPPIDKNQQ